MVSSHMPKVVPPRPNTSIKMGMSHFSRPFSFRITADTPASTAPVFITTLRKPPTIKMNTHTSTAS